MRLPRTSLGVLFGLTFGVTLVSGGGCTTLPDVAAGTCGNGVLDPGEECDTFAPNGARCRSQDEAFGCRYDCHLASAGVTATTCPKGFVCGAADGICQRPQGQFGDVSTSFEASAGHLLLADFDGDGHQDVVTTSRPDVLALSSARVFFFDSATVAPRGLAIPALGFAPTAGDINGDGRQDLVFGGYQGINVFLGRSDRSLDAQAYGRFPFPPKSSAAAAIARGFKDPLFPYGEVPILLVDTVVAGKPLRMITIGSAGSDPGKNVLAVVNKTPNDLVAIPVTGNFIEGSPCDELIYGWKGEGQLNILTLCDTDGSLRKTPELIPKKALTLPSAATSVGVFVADLNGDGHQDLIVGGAEGSLVAFGRGDGTFSGKVDLAAGVEVAKLRCETLDFNPCPQPLAVEAAESKKFGGPLIVIARTAASPAAVVRATKVTQAGADVNVSSVALATKLSGDWTSAIIADFNGNGIPDIVAGSNSGLDLDFYNGSPTGALNPSKIPTDYPVAHLAVGDYDGDLINDLSFVEIGGGELGDDQVSVAYGKPAGPPEDPLPMGAFAGIKQLMSARFDNQDEAAEIGVIYQLDGDQITALDGNGSRQLLSPFGLTNQEATKIIVGMPLSVGVGKFTATGALPGLGVFAGEQNDDFGKALAAPRLWFVPVNETSPQLSGAAMSPLITGVQTAIEGSGVSVHSAAGDLDGDGIDELVTLVPSAKGVGMSVLVAHIGEVASGPIGPKGTGLVPGPLVAVDKLPGGPLSDLVVVDIDGDGHKDVVVFVDVRLNGKLAVLWNDGKGGLSADAAVRLDPPAGKWRGFGVVDYKGALPVMLVGVTEKGVYSIAGTAADKRALVSTQLAGVEGGQAVAAGDVSGDGIPDLLVANGGRVNVHPGLARKP